MSRSLEPFDGKFLSKFLTQELGAVLERHVGSHQHYRLPNGRRVGSDTQGAIPCSLTREIARALDMSYPELRARMGHPVTVTRRGVTKPTARPQRPAASKAAVLRLVSELREALTRVEQENRNGLRDPSHYERVYAALSAARAELNQCEGAAA